MANNDSAAKRIRIKWVKSASGAPKEHKRTIRALGFRRLNGEVVHEATPQLMGMVNSVSHLLDVTEVSE